MPYDPNLRRDTPLARKLITRIRADGPITVRDYMDACLNDPEFGYYRTRAAIGRSGDFITAPEISQVFGELIGLWCAVVWQQMGSPPLINLIELGSGRGTLLADALRATRVLPGFRDAVSVHILDQNPVLVEQQKVALAASGARVRWCALPTELPWETPLVCIANEFLDTLPVEQFEKRERQWHWRTIGLDAGGQLAHVPAAPLLTERGPASCPDADGSWDDGSIYERQDFREWTSYLRTSAAKAPMAALFLDYAYDEPPRIETLQAVREHRQELILTSPGEADLSGYVSFSELREELQSPFSAESALTVDGPVTQSEYLGQLGIMERASRLMAANPAKANAIEMGIARLMAPQGMGTRFKAIGIRSPSLPPLPGFAVNRT